MNESSNADQEREGLFPPPEHEVRAENFIVAVTSFATALKKEYTDLIFGVRNETEIDIDVEAEAATLHEMEGTPLDDEAAKIARQISKDAEIESANETKVSVFANSSVRSAVEEFRDQVARLAALPHHAGILDADFPNGIVNKPTAKNQGGKLIWDSNDMRPTYDALYRFIKK